MINIKINGIPFAAPAGSTILEACHAAGVKIPTLCYLKEINAIGACRMCVVEVKGARSLVAACVYPINEGMEIFTNSPAVEKSRRMTLELMLSVHKKECLTCVRSQNCELQQLSKELGIEIIPYDSIDDRYEEDASTPHLVRDNDKCILCRRCVAVCKNNQDVNVIGAVERGFATNINCAFEKDLADVPCVNCGQCVAVCPTGALVEKDNTADVWAALNDPSKHVVVGAAPSVRATLGECFGMPIGTNVEGKLAAALRRLGFDGVYDVDTAADLTIMEEGTEFIGRVKNNGPLPIITSCSPGWVKYCETFFPEFIPNLSSAKSPQGMFGAVMKTYYAEKMGLDPKDIYVVSVMPCTAKKFEAGRPELSASGYPDIDAAITTRELSRMIQKAGIMFTSLPDEEFDPLFGIATGAGHIFGATGGVTEAALRTVAEILDGKPLEKLEFTAVRGTEGIKEASYTIAGNTYNICVCSGLANAKKVLNSVKSGEKNYHLIEVMACPGGCVNGGGQPIQTGDTRNFVDIKALRAKALYDEDSSSTYRKSHDNPVVKELYETYFGEPNSHKAHEILHTHYTARKKY